MLIVTARNPLQVSYGSQGYAQVRAALDAWAKVEGHSVLAVDDAEDMQRFGLNARSNSPADVQLAIRSMAANYPEMVDGVLVAGGPSVIPFWTLNNPVASRTTDPDDTVLSDNPYGAVAETMNEYLAPSRPLGRLAVPDGASASQFVTMVRGLPHRTGASLAARQGAALVVNQDWLDYSQRVAQAMPEPRIWWLSPGFELDADSQQDVSRAFLYFNLHGFSGNSDWQGYSTAQRSFVPAVTPDGLDRSFVAGAVSFAECCYGAQIAGRTPANSCALKLVQEGASFIGATGLAFGSYIASDLVLEDADFLARAFFQELGGGLSLGSALQQARSAYLGDSMEPQSGEIWQCKQKTLLQFVLYGNPQTIP